MLKLTDLLYEVACISCAKTTFALPYKTGLCHRFACQACKRTTIAHIFPTGEVNITTLEGFQCAKKEYMQELENYMKTAGILVNAYRCKKNTSSPRGRVRFKVTRSGQHITLVYQDHNKRGFLTIQVRVKIKGLLASAYITQSSNTYDYGGANFRLLACSLPNLSSFANRSLASSAPKQGGNP